MDIELGRNVITENIPDNTEDEINVAVCPGCARTFRKDEDAWGTDTCPHCGQKLYWFGIIE